MRTVVRRPRKRIHIPPLAVLAVMLLAVLLVLYLTGVFSGGMYRRLSAKAVTVMPFSSEDIFSPFGEGVVYIDQKEGQLLALDAKGKTVWGFANATADMTLHPADHRLAVVVSKKLQMISDAGVLLYDKLYDLPIERIAVSDQLTVLQLRSETDIHTLTVLDDSGEIIDTFSDTGKQTFLDFGLFGDGTSLWVLSADISSVSPAYQFSTYRYDSKKNLLAGYQSTDQMLYAPVFTAKNTFLVGTDTILEINSESKLQSSRQCSGYQLSATGLCKKQTYMLLEKLNVDGSVPQSIGELLVITEKTRASLALPEAALGVQVGAEKLYAFSPYNLYVFDPVKFSYVIYNLPIKADKTQACGAERMLLSSSGQVYLITLPQ